MEDNASDRSFTALPSFQSYRATRAKDQSSATCLNQSCKLYNRAQFTNGQTVCRSCKTRFNKDLIRTVLTPVTSPPSHFQNGKMPSAHKKEFGLSIRRLREDRAISQQQLAEEMGVARTYVSKFENGHILPGIEQCVKLANALNMRLSELMEETLEAIIYPPFASAPPFEH